MTSKGPYNSAANWQQQAQQCLINGNYRKAVSFYEQAVEAEPGVRSHYWYLGLALLLQGQEAEAQTTWQLALAEGELGQVNRWKAELAQVLQIEVERWESLEDDSVAWALRQQLREINPTDINNLLYLIQLAIKLERFTDDELTLGITELLQRERPTDLDSNLLLQVLQNVLDYAPLHPFSLEFVEACLPHFHESQALLGVLLPACDKIAFSLTRPGLAACFAELYLHLDPGNLEVLRHLVIFYQYAWNHSKVIETAKLYYSLSQALPDRVSANFLMLQGLMLAGDWKEACSVFQHQESLLVALVKEQPIPLGQAVTRSLFSPTSLLPYFKDDPKGNRSIQNQVVQICQSNVQLYAKEQAERYRQRPHLSQGSDAATRPLKIGYLSRWLATHSIGWLARWLFQHHDRDCYQINAYLINYRQVDDPIQAWYADQASQVYKAGSDSLKIAEQIYQDEIDILVDLDSITTDISCEIMALKPAPIQVTWLGWDASGLSTIDYFIADPYVLPDSAQDYYTEQIWRLPQTYVAVDGFEVGVPTLRRDLLHIPSDAVVYLSVQTGLKRHPDTIRLQMKVLKGVPDSYLLIGGYASQDSIKNLFSQIAEEEGISRGRLRFLPTVTSEEVHRANLSIADVVLDTYPYNGATTTLETLWMGIPLVTRVGEQFASRNSYTMLMNVGVTEGIAWTDEEYVEWGIRLGKDPGLRQQIVWQLRASRQISPLWDAKQFTREMENAYEQMWQRYLETQSIPSSSSGNTRKQHKVALKDILQQRDLQLIIFPDWSQAEDSLFQDLGRVIRALVTHPEKSRMILLVDTSNTDPAAAKQALADVVSSVLPPEVLNDPNGPALFPLGQLDETQWQALLLRLYARIVLEHENKQTTTAARADQVPSYELDSLMNELVPPPEEMINLVGIGGVRFFKHVGNTMLQHFIEFCELKPSEKVLEVGCGCGRIALAFTKYLEDGGAYEGFDIDIDAINWCREKITPKHPNFRFQLADIYNKAYNPDGQLTASEYKFPYDDESFDFVFLTSVFIHMLPPDIENYLSEIVRVLKTGGKCFSTFFLLNAESLKLIDEWHLDFKYKIGLYRTIDQDIPESALAYDESFIRTLYEKHKLKIVEPIHYGFWSGRISPQTGRDHDFVIAVK